MGLIPRAWVRHIHGTGQLEWEAEDRLAECLSRNEPFPGDLARGEPRLLLLRLAGGGRLGLPVQGWTLQLPARGELAGFADLVWPGEDSDLLRQLGWSEPVPDGQVALVLALQGEALAGGTARLARVRIEADATGRADLLLGRRYPRDTGSADMLRDLCGRLCLPATPKERETALDEGTALSIHWDGALRLAAETWAGISLRGAVPGLELLPEMAATAGLEAGFRLKGQIRRTGRLGLRLSGAGGQGRIRAVLSVGRESSGRLAVDVSASAMLVPAGTVPALEEILGRLLGLDIPRLASILARLAEGAEATDPAEPLTALVLNEVMDPLLQTAEARVLPPEALRRLASATSALLALDDTLRSLVLRHAGGLSALRERLGEVFTAAQWSDLSVETVRYLAGEGVDVAALVERVQDLRAWRRQLERVLSLEILPTLEQILARLAGVARARDAVAWLARFRTPDDLRATLQSPVRRLVEAAVGRSLAQVPTEDLQRLLSVAATLDDALETAGRGFDQALRVVLAREWEAGASLELLREDGEQTALAGEFDLAEDGARKAFRALIQGDAGPALTGAPGVRISDATFVHRLQRRCRAEVHAGPLHWTSLENLIATGRLEVRPEGHGWAHTLEVEARAEKRRTDPDAGVRHSQFTMRATARALRPKIGPDEPFPEAVFRATYRLNVEDPVTRPEELAALLEPAAAFGIMSGASPGEIADELLAGAGTSPAVRLDWHVRVPAAAFRAVLAEEVPDRMVESAILEIFRWNYLRHGRPGSWLRILGAAVNVPENRALFERRGHLGGAPCIACLGPAQGVARLRRIPLGPLDRQRLEALYRVARRGGAVFGEMAGHLRAGTAEMAAIEGFAAEVGALHNRLARWGLRLDTLPHVLLRAGRQVGGEAAAGTAALEAEIRPRRGEPVRRFLKAGSP